MTLKFSVELITNSKIVRAFYIVKLFYDNNFIVASGVLLMFYKHKYNFPLNFPFGVNAHPLSLFHEW